jgi:hypothetical protein
MKFFDDDSAHICDKKYIAGVNAVRKDRRSSSRVLKPFRRAAKKAYVCIDRVLHTKKSTAFPYLPGEVPISPFCRLHTRENPAVRFAVLSSKCFPDSRDGGFYLGTFLRYLTNAGRHGIPVILIAFVHCQVKPSFQGQPRHLIALKKRNQRVEMPARVEILHHDLPK